MLILVILQAHKNMGHYNPDSKMLPVILLTLLPLCECQGILGAGSSFFDTSLFDFSGPGLGSSGGRGAGVNVLSGGVGGSEGEDKRSLLIMGGTKKAAVINPWVQNLRNELRGNSGGEVL